MASLIPGYEYDIFISYRQKDNKGDRWVSEFVDALKTELESTFKEEISVFFDNNPHDGLLETHDVDASLKEKLKCLVFIPIISRTYCDPKSFAWEHEFKAFVELASHDRFGLKVKLPNGNVTNRVLPIRIHDLDSEDVKLFESATGGVIRTLDFIFKTAFGVNRPLKAKEDHPTDNINKTYYQDQINKVSLAIKEIITALGQNEQKPGEVSKEIYKPVSVKGKSKRTAIIAGSIVALALIMLGIFYIPKLFKPEKELEKSIAVLPFFNDSPDEENNHFINGIMDEILNNLQVIKDLRVISRSSVEQYRGTARPAIPKIAKQLGVNFIVEGSGQKYGNSVRLRVQLIEAVTDKHLWAESFEREIKEAKDIFGIQSQIAQAIASQLKVLITPAEKQIIEKMPTENLKAYDDYSLGRYYRNNDNEENLLLAIECFKSAIAKDPEFALAYTEIARAYMALVGTANWLPEEAYSKAKEAVLKALELDNNLSEAHSALANIRLDYDWDFKGAEKEFILAIELNPNSPIAYRAYAGLLYISCRPEEALEKYKQALALDPNSDWMKFYTGFYSYYAFKTDSTIQILQKEVESDPKNAEKHYILGYLYLVTEDYIKSVQELENAIEIDSIPMSYYLYLGISYNRTGKPDETKKLLEKLDVLAKGKKSVSFGKAVLLAELGKTDQSIYWLKKAYEERFGGLICLKVEPHLCLSIRSDPRFIEIYKKIWTDD
jgi:TolB-like protein/Tfp pilus assembly protein PilF